MGWDGHYILYKLVEYQTKGILSHVYSDVLRCQAKTIDLCETRCPEVSAKLCSLLTKTENGLFLFSVKKLLSSSGTLTYDPIFQDFYLFFQKIDLNCTGPRCPIRT